MIETYWTICSIMPTILGSIVKMMTCVCGGVHVWLFLEHNNIFTWIMNKMFIRVVKFVMEMVMGTNWICNLSCTNCVFMSYKKWVQRGKKFHQHKMYLIRRVRVTMNLWCLCKLIHENVTKYFVTSNNSFRLFDSRIYIINPCLV